MNQLGTGLIESGGIQELVGIGFPLVVSNLEISNLGWLKLAV